MSPESGNAPVVLDASDLTRSFGAVKANDAVCLDLLVGEIHALIGPNGAGKSTFIRQLAGDLAPDSGAIRFRGRNIARLCAAQRARLGMARTFQISSLIPEFTVLENVMLAHLGRLGQSMRFFAPVARNRNLGRLSRECLARVGLDSRRREQVSRISHGERRLLEIAIALAMEPAAFLLDEPTAGLDQEGSHRLIDLLDGLRQTAPVLLVEHDMDAVFALADRISVLVDGRLIATGRPDAIRSNDAVRAAYLGMEHP